MQQAKTIPSPQAERRPGWINRDRITAMLMIAPSILAIAIFVYGFIAWTGFVSLTAWNGILPDYTFVGFENYFDVFNTGRFQTNIRNLLVFTVFFLLTCLVMGLGLAVMVDSVGKGESIFRSIYIFPMSLSFIVTGVAWAWLFTPGNFPEDPTGLNLLFHRMGLDFLQAGWITDASVWPDWRPPGLKTKLLIPLALIPVVVAAVWQMVGFTMAMYLAGLRSIPDEIREAARVDGASEWQVFRKITLPMLQPVTLSAVIILGHISLKIFDLIMTMTGGGPGNNTEIPGVLMYELTFKANKVAQGAAIAMVLLVLVALLIVPYLYYQFKNEVER
jgi:glucose/mannose transport system permease protein